MRWRLWTKPDPREQEAADHALLRAEYGLEAARRQAPEVDRVTDRLNKLHEENHWSEQFRIAMRRF